jgi:5-(carboxyamino)imidazole ribonucleotide mutase
MPGGVPVGTLGIGDAGAKNAGLLAVRMLANQDRNLRDKLHEFERTQAEKVLQASLPIENAS